MKPRIFYLSGCSTCRRILSEFPLDGATLQDLRKDPLSEAQLQELREVAGSYDRLFSGRSLQIKARGINLKSLTEEDKRDLLLEHYSFLKRPVILFEDEVFVGSSKTELERLAKKII